MSPGKMHADELDIDAALVRRLLSGQFPQWADLPLEPVPSYGTVNALYRLGRDMVLRLPRTPGGVAGIEKERRWLPKLAQHLPLAVPVPLAKGKPGKDYPWPWSVNSWLKGETATRDRIEDLPAFAKTLARFVIALQAIDATGGPVPEPTERGVPLAERDHRVRAAIESLEGEVDIDAVTAAWEASLRAPAWNGPAVWLHGDLYEANLLVTGGRLSGVIDWGILSVGDPAPDLLAAWSLFSGEAREVFRRELMVDDAMWARGRGWALSVALIALPYYMHTNPAFVELSRRMIAEVLFDQRKSA